MNIALSLVLSWLLFSGRITALSRLLQPHVIIISQYIETSSGVWGRYISVQLKVACMCQGDVVWPSDLPSYVCWDWTIGWNSFRRRRICAAGVFRERVGCECVDDRASRKIYASHNRKSFIPLLKCYARVSTLVSKWLCKCLSSRPIEVNK